MAKQGLSAGEQRFVEDEMEKRYDTPIFMDWVRKKKDKKTEKRLVVVGKYRVVTIKRSYTGAKSVQRDGHLYTLREVNADSGSSLRLGFTDFNLSFESPQVADFVYAVHTSIQSIFYEFPQSKLPSMNIAPVVTDAKPLPDYFAAGPCANFSEIYRSYCNYSGAPANKSVIAYLEDIAKSGSTYFDVSQCVGLESQDFDFGPLFLALRHNSYFTSLSLRNVGRKEVLTLLGQTLKSNKAIADVVMSGVDGSRGVYEVGTALEDNSDIQLRSIDLSNNKLGEETLGLARGFSHMKHSLTKLDLSNCGLAKTLMAACIDGLKDAASVDQLTDINFSGNEIDAIMSDSLVELLGQLQAVEFLGLAGTGINVATVVQFLSDRHHATLLELDISRNKVGKSELSAVTTLVKTSEHLRYLGVNGCGLTEEMFETVCVAIGGKSGATSFKLDAAANELGLKKEIGKVCVERAITETKNLSSLSLRDNKFKLKPLLDVIETVALAPHVAEFDIGCVKQVHCAQVIDAVVKLLGSSSTLVSIILSGDAKFSYGKELGPFFQSLQTANVNSLDISNNKAGHSVLNMMCLALRHNTSITSIMWDGNLSTLETWQALRECLKTNVTLLDVEYPKNDVTRYYANAKDKVGAKEQVARVWHDIGDSLKKNQAEQAGAPKPKIPTDTWRTSGRINSIMVGNLNMRAFHQMVDTGGSKPVIGDIQWNKRDGLADIVDYHGGDGDGGEGDDATPAAASSSGSFTPPPVPRDVAAHTTNAAPVPIAARSLSGSSVTPAAPSRSNGSQSDDVEPPVSPRQAPVAGGVALLPVLPGAGGPPARMQGRAASKTTSNATPPVVRKAHSTDKSSSSISSSTSSTLQRPKARSMGRHAGLKVQQEATLRGKEPPMPAVSGQSPWSPRITEKKGGGSRDSVHNLPPPAVPRDDETVEVTVNHSLAAPVSQRDSQGPPPPKPDQPPPPRRSNTSATDTPVAGVPLRRSNTDSRFGGRGAVRGRGRGRAVRIPPMPNAKGDDEQPGLRKVSASPPAKAVGSPARPPRTQRSATNIRKVAQDSSSPPPLPARDNPGRGCK